MNGSSSKLVFLVDFLSHATIVGFMRGLQQLKGLIGISHFTNKTDVVSAIKAVFRSLHDEAVKGKSASQSTDLRPLKPGNTGTGLLVSGSVSGTIPSSAVVQVNQNKQKSSRVAQARKKIATGKNKGVVMKEVLEKMAKA